MTNKDAFILFFSKEKKQLFGHRHISLWITCGVFLLALLSAGFSAASLEYLREKMSDPFVTCVDISVSQFRAKDYVALKKFIDSNENSLGYSSSEPVHLLYDIFINNQGKNRQLDGRTLSMVSPLKNTTILSKENVICQREDTITDSDFGIILSLDGLEHMNMAGECPAFVRRYIKKNNTPDHFAVPVLAIVKQLPNMCDFIATDAYAQHEIADENDHFNIAEPKYNKFLQLIVADSVSSEVLELLKLNTHVLDVNEVPYFKSWNDAFSQFNIYCDLDSCKETFMDSLYLSLLTQYPSVYRLYSFEYYPFNKQYHEPALISCYFEQDSLQYKVQEFSKVLDQETGYKIDMSKVENLKNLDRVQQMGKALSSIIIFIVIVFIGVFIYFLLNTHFQKIQRNIGTFKAFGVSENMIYGVYCLIISYMIILAYTISFAITAISTELINYIYPMVDEKGVYDRLDYLVWQNGLILFLALTLAILTTTIVVYKILRHTPGDLIYNRNQK